MRPIVMLEFAARSTAEPWESRRITCDAGLGVAGAFSSATARVMRPQRTFWEKATAVHAFCQQGEFRGGERFSRHWHDLIQLDRAGIADAAIADRALALAVAKHKSRFFAEKTAAGELIDYVAAVSGGLRLVPSDTALGELSLDYARMLDDGLLMGDAEPFETLLERCRDLEARVNKVK